MANGETNLEKLIHSMQPELHEGTYVFHSSNIPFAEAAGLDPVMIFKEKEGTTLVLKQEFAENAGLAYQYPARMITLNVHSSLDAVGFLAQITQKLAQKGVSVNAVSANFHDHLFVPKDRADDAMEVLNAMVNE